MTRKNPLRSKGGQGPRAVGVVAVPVTGWQSDSWIPLPQSSLLQPSTMEDYEEYYWEYYIARNITGIYWNMRTMRTMRTMMRNITGNTILLGILEFTWNTGILLDLLGFI